MSRHDDEMKIVELGSDLYEVKLHIQELKFKESELIDQLFVKIIEQRQFGLLSINHRRLQKFIHQRL